MFKKKIMFRTIGTNSDSYIKRFFEKYLDANYFWSENIDNKIRIFDQNNNKIDFFTSIATWKQFKDVLIAFGFIKNDVGKYKIVKKDFDIDYVANNIFTKDFNKGINLIRQSRLISLLVYINSLNASDFIDGNIVGQRGPTRYKNVISEISRWEKDVTKKVDTLKSILERIEEYDFK